MSETIIKVLLIEDDQDDSLFFQDLLSEAKRARFFVDAALTGKEGLKYAQKNVYDIILLDYRLPDTDGLDLIPQLLKYQVQVPVVMVTSHGDRNLQTRALEAGALEYLEKGGITAELLERTCIYANGLSQASQNKFPDLKLFLEQNSSNCAALLTMYEELKECRNEVNQKLNRLTKQNDDQNKKILAAVKHIPKFRWLLDWIAGHRPTALFLFICFLVLLITAVILSQTMDLEVIRQLLELKKSAALTPSLTEGLRCLLG